MVGTLHDKPAIRPCMSQVVEGRSTPGEQRHRFCREYVPDGRDYWVVTLALCLQNVMSQTGLACQAFPGPRA